MLKTITTNFTVLRALASALYLFAFMNSANAHHGKDSKKYLCKLTASAGLNGRFVGGDGTPEGGQFFGEFVEQFRYGDQIKLEVHGGIDVGGYLKIEDKMENSKINQNHLEKMFCIIVYP